MRARWWSSPTACRPRPRRFSPESSRTIAAESSWATTRPTAKARFKTSCPWAVGTGQPFNPEDRGALKLTISQFYRVNGDSTQNLGVPSDVVLPSLLDHMDLGESSLENASKFDRVEPADYQPWNRVNPELVSMLQQRSQARVAD